MLTFDPVAKGKTGVGGTESVTQDLLLEIDDWLKHFLILDLSGRDHNAAVHEVSDGVGQIFVSLGQVGFQTEHLSEQKHRELSFTCTKQRRLERSCDHEAAFLFSLTQSAIRAPMARPHSL